jgi:hypothetical protein
MVRIEQGAPVTEPDSRTELKAGSQKDSPPCGARRATSRAKRTNTITACSAFAIARASTARTVSRMVMSIMPGGKSNPRATSVTTRHSVYFLDISA